MVAPLNPKSFEKYARTLTIESKDEGLVRFRLRKSQIEVLKRVTKALMEDKRQIYLLKSRQIGASTLGLALDLYWCQQHSGIHGALITDKDDNRESFRTTLDSMLGSPGTGADSQVAKHNRLHMVFKNRSRLIYQVAGMRTGGSLARGKGLNYAHSTEVSSWGDPQAIDSLMASFSSKHPHRLYLFESTARGYNLWYDMCDQAQRSRSQAFLFVTWWHSPEFSFPRGTNEYRVYGREDPTPEENEWIRQVKILYKHDITKEQLAWWRHKIEDEGYKIEAMFEEYPPTEEHAWVMTGAQFFSTSSLTRMMTQARSTRPREYVFGFGRDYQSLERRSAEGLDPHLLVWEEPVEGAYYCIGADPCGGAGGSSGDDAVIEVLRCFGDGVEQVAEFRMPGIPGYCFAWVLAYMAKRYQPNICNLEINGAGIAVADELSRLDFAGSYYLYRRADSLGGQGYLHWRTTSENKRWIMEQMRTLVEREMLLVRSRGAVKQLGKIEQIGMFVGGSSVAGDDCVMGLALGIEAWSKNFMEMLKGAKIWRPKRDETGNTVDHPLTIIERQVQDVLGNAGLRPADDVREKSFGEGFFSPAVREEEF